MLQLLPPESTCCASQTISSTGGTAEHQSTRLGEYMLDGEYNGMPRFKKRRQEGGANDIGNVLFHSELDGPRWIVSSSVTSGAGLRTSQDPDSNCPNQYVGMWEYHVPDSDTWREDNTATVNCDGASGRQL